MPAESQPLRCRQGRGIQDKNEDGKTQNHQSLFLRNPDLEAEGLFTGGEKRIRLELFSGKAEVGSAAMAAYGFEEGTKEIMVRSGQANP